MILQWNEIENHDENGNSCWEAPSSFCGEGSPFMFRIVAILRNNRIEWDSISDMECGGDLSPEFPCLSLEAAKAACEEANETILLHLDQ